MKAAICYEFGRPLSIEDVLIDDASAGEVKVRSAAVGICHSDVHHIRGEWGGSLPVVSGHEVSGIVEEVGEGVTRVKPGDPVVVSALRSCGTCYYCMIGSPQCCVTEFPRLDKAVRLRTKAGEPLHAAHRVAGFAEYVLVDQSQVAPVPKDMPLDSAALLACAVVTGAGAVFNTARVEFGRTVVVIGTGGVGLNAVQAAALSGAYPIIAVDILDSKLEAAREFGATHTLRGDRDDAIGIVHELTSGRGAEYVFVTVGNVTAMTRGFGMTAMRGTLIVVGVPRFGTDVCFPANQFGQYERRVIGSGMGSTNLRVDIPKYVALYQDGRLKLDELISERYPLERINDAIQATEEGEVLRNVIVFE